VAAVAGAVGEAVTNASKHGRADRVTVYAEPADHPHFPAPGLFVSVKDNGAGFPADEVQEGLGLSRSIRARIEEVGGTVNVQSRPGRGAELTLRVPAEPGPVS
jgi:signal transduction histidine kinase